MATDIATCKSDLQSMATAINEHHTQVLLHARSTGELLLQAKALLPHGEWLPWLEANCQVSPIIFLDMDGEPSSAPLQGQAALYLGSSPERFIDAFREFGWTLATEVSQ